MNTAAPEPSAASIAQALETLGCIVAATHPRAYNSADIRAGLYNKGAAALGLLRPILSAPAAAVGGEAVDWQLRYLPPNGPWSRWMPTSQEAFDGKWPYDNALQTEYRALVPATPAAPVGGFVVVPREATHEMEYALSQALDSGDYSIGECLNRANAAAPESSSRPKSGIAMGTEIEGIPWTEEMEDTFNKTMPKVRELVGLDSPSASDVRAYMVDGRVEQGLFFDKDAAENMALANCGTVIPLIASPAAQPSADQPVFGWWREDGFVLDEYFGKGDMLTQGYKPLVLQCADCAYNPGLCDTHDDVQPSAKDGVRELGPGSAPEVAYLTGWNAAKKHYEATTASGLVDGLCERLQRKCSEWGTYWRAPDAHGVNLSREQALELLRDALGVEVEIAE